MLDTDKTLFSRPELIMYQSDPSWFKSGLLNACTRSHDDNITHIEYAEANFPERPIATMLKYLRPLVPDSINPYDEEIDETFGPINKMTCVILLRDKEVGFIEPLTKTKIEIPGIKGDDISTMYESSISKNKKMVIASGNDEVPPFIYVDANILDFWEETTLPYKKELKEYLSRIENKTMDNFSLNYVSELEIKKRIKKYAKKKEE